MEKEIIFNLWYVINPQKYIVYLKAKPYVYAADEEDEDKLDFLVERAKWDFEVAKDYPLPKDLVAHFEKNTDYIGIPQFYVQMPEAEMDLFEEVFLIIEKELPQNCNLKLPAQVLNVLTPLHISVDGKIMPVKE